MRLTGDDGGEGSESSLPANFCALEFIVIIIEDYTPEASHHIKVAIEQAFASRCRNTSQSPCPH